MVYTCLGNAMLLIAIAGAEIIILNQITKRCFVMKNNVLYLLSAHLKGKQLQLNKQGMCSL